MNILVAGDFCPQHRVAQLFNEGRYAEVLGEVKPIVEQTDYAIVNFECPVTQGGERPIKKQGPNLQCTAKGLEAVKCAGFDCVTLANNHFRDFGDEGCTNTLTHASANALDVVGGGKSLIEASRTLYANVNGKALAIINCCEHEYSIATETTAGSNPLNPIQQFYAIKEAREKADYILVIVHGGHEMWQLPSPRMVETYRFFIDAGADAVVNHHQHCFSGYEVYHDKPIFYGLGNFCFDKPHYYTGLWEYGYMVKLHLDKQIMFDIIPYEQCKDEAKVRLLDGHYFDDRLKELNSIIADEARLADETQKYYQRSLRGIQLAFEPYRGRILSKLFLMGWLPRLMDKGKLYKLQNMVTCEAHRDKSLFLLNNIDR